MFRPFFRGLHADVLLRSDDPAAALTALDAELRRLRTRALIALSAPDPEIATEIDRARTAAAAQGATLFLERVDQGHPAPRPMSSREG